MDAAAVTAITANVDFATIVVGIGVIAAAIMVVVISMRGAGMLIGMVSRGRG